MSRLILCAALVSSLLAACSTPPAETGYTIVVSPPAEVSKPQCGDLTATIDPVIHDRTMFRRARVLVRDTGPAWQLLLEPTGTGPLTTDPRSLTIAATVGCAAAGD